MGERDSTKGGGINYVTRLVFDHATHRRFILAVIGRNLSRRNMISDHGGHRRFILALIGSDLHTHKHTHTHTHTHITHIWQEARHIAHSEIFFFSPQADLIHSRHRPSGSVAGAILWFEFSSCGVCKKFQMGRRAITKAQKNVNRRERNQRYVNKPEVKKRKGEYDRGRSRQQEEHYLPIQSKLPLACAGD